MSDLSHSFIVHPPLHTRRCRRCQSFDHREDTCPTIGVCWMIIPTYPSLVLSFLSIVLMYGLTQDREIDIRLLPKALGIPRQHLIEVDDPKVPGAMRTVDGKIVINKNLKYGGCMLCRLGCCVAMSCFVSHAYSLLFVLSFCCPAGCAFLCWRHSPRRQSQVVQASRVCACGGLPGQPYLPLLPGLAA